jgi:hypothetical protein
MTLDKFKIEIQKFSNKIREYRTLLSNSRDDLVRIVRNHEEIDEQRAGLNIQYGSLSKYIKKIGNYPMRSDVGGGPYPVYENALSAGILQRVGPCLDVVIQDLEFIIGKLNNMTEIEFEKEFSKKQNHHYISAGGNITAGGDIFVGDKRIEDDNKKIIKWYEKWWFKFLIFPIVTGFVVIYLANFLISK